MSARTPGWLRALGDQTARMQGRVTLNPMPHIDPVGTLIMPAIIIFGPFIGFTLFSGILIGWAKPTPVISRNFAKSAATKTSSRWPAPSQICCWP